MHNRREGMIKMNGIYSKIEYKKKAAHCSECGAIFFPCEEIFTWDAGRTCKLLCVDCFDHYFSEMSRFEIADLIGSEVYICGQ